MKVNLTLFMLLLSHALVAQTVCDSISVESVQYAPFSDGVQIEVLNGTMSPLSGPAIDVLDPNGVLLGTSAGQFFAFVPGNVALNRASFSPPPSSPFSGTIILHYSGPNGVVVCNYPVKDVDLCPSEACIPLQVFGYQQGGPFVDAELDWSVTDLNGIIQASGVMEFAGTSFGYAIAELCLPPGAYTLHMSQAVAEGSNILVGVTQVNSAYTNGTFAQLPIGGSVDHPFNFFELCVDGAQGIGTERLGPLRVIVDGRTLRISVQDGSALGTFAVLDSGGRLARSITANTSTTTYYLGDLAPGVYLLSPFNGVSDRPAQRFVLE